MDEPTGIISTLITGVIIGLLGRVVVPAAWRAPIGCLMTMLVGLVGATLGLVVASAIDAGPWVTGALQMAIAVVGMVLVCAASAAGTAHGRSRPVRDRGRAPRSRDRA